MSSKKQKAIAPIAERIKRLAGLAYLATMLVDQGDRKSARKVLDEISNQIELDQNLARDLYPELKLACQAFGYSLQTVEPQSIGNH